MVSIRTCTTVNAHGEWGLFFLHRERGLTRFYVQLNRGDEAEVPKESITLKLIVQGLQHLLRPYTITVKHCEWWSSYRIGHYLSNGMSKNNRVFHVGDAVHNHSPLVGLGMNINMQDSHNLGWKLAGVVKKELDPRILSTFETERRPVAETLISTDRFHLELVDTMSTTGSEEAWMQERSLEPEPFLQGFGAHYQDSFLTGAPHKKQKKLDIVMPGKRFPELVVRQISYCRFCGGHSTAKGTGEVCFVYNRAAEEEASAAFFISGVLAIHRASKSVAVHANLTGMLYPSSQTNTHPSGFISAT
ncbi:hypothetical protein PENNAL_c0023G00909, partial [Penicillium nalgiovense]